MPAAINFTDEQIKEIIRLYVEENLGMRKIGEKFGCSERPIKRILTEYHIDIKTPSKNKYHPGDRLGPYEILLIEKFNYNPEKPKDKQKCRSFGKFLCPNHPEDDPHYFITRIARVSSGVTRQCKQCQRKTREKNLKAYQQTQRLDLTGQRYEKLTAIKIIEEKRTVDRSCIWLCQCDCGKICKVSTNNWGRNKSCGCVRSKGEDKIADILTKEKIKFERERTFEKCINPKTNAKLKFDFYLPDYNTCIEYDGEQHFNKDGKGYFAGEYDNIKYRDEVKNQYCKDNNIKLIRIPYTDYDILDFDYIKEHLVA